MIEDLVTDWRRLDERIENFSTEINALAKQDSGCERLMSVPGIGPIISSAVVAAIGSGDGFSLAPARFVFRRTAKQLLYVRLDQPVPDIAEQLHLFCLVGARGLPQVGGVVLKDRGHIRMLGSEGLLPERR